MTIPQAVEFIRDLYRQWAAWKYDDAVKRGLKSTCCPDQSRREDFAARREINLLISGQNLTVAQSGVKRLLGRDSQFLGMRNCGRRVGWLYAPESQSRDEATASR